jgi:hypothetical protein
VVGRHDARVVEEGDDVGMKTVRRRPESGTCTLEAALGRDAPCPGSVCPLWDVEAGACVLDGVRSELLALPDVAGHLLELRQSLERGDTTTADEERARFFRRLNLENVHDGGAS